MFPIGSYAPNLGIKKRSGLNGAKRLEMDAIDAINAINAIEAIKAQRSDVEDH